MSAGSGTSKAKGPGTWLSFGLNNASTIALVLGGFWFVGKPHAENFIVETVEFKVAAKLTERIGAVEAETAIIRSDQQDIKSQQASQGLELKRQGEEQKKQSETLRRIEKLLQGQ